MVYYASAYSLNSTICIGDFESGYLFGSLRECFRRKNTGYEWIDYRALEKVFVSKL